MASRKALTAALMQEVREFIAVADKVALANLLEDTFYHRCLYETGERPDDMGAEASERTLFFEKYRWCVRPLPEELPEAAHGKGAVKVR